MGFQFLKMFQVYFYLCYQIKATDNDFVMARSIRFSDKPYISHSHDNNRIMLIIFIVFKPENNS
jgi:hypothetical protein